MATKVSKRITSQTIRENAKRDLSPKWDGAETWDGPKFRTHFRDAMNYYNLNHTGKDLKPKVIDWMARNGYSKDEIADFKRTKDWRCQITLGALATCLLRGMPAVHPGFNQGRDSTEWVRNEITRIIEAGQNDDPPVVENKKNKIEVPVISIQDRIRDQAGIFSEEIDAAIDRFIMDPNNFDPKEFKMVNLLRQKGTKAAQARYIKSFYEPSYNELMLLASGNADDQLKEGYRHHPRKNVRKLIEFFESVISACDQIAAEAKVLKKPRAKKVKPAEDQVKKLKFKLSDDKLGIASVPPAQLIKAQGAVVFNTKTRKIGYYIAMNSEGLTVKNSSLSNFTQKSIQKTLRKPAEQLKEFKELNTQRRFETWFEKSVKTTETALNGRISVDVVILKVFK